MWALVPAAVKKALDQVDERNRYLKHMHGKDALTEAIHTMESARLQLDAQREPYYDATSRLAYFEVDAFYSVGAYMHVVVRMQQGRPVRLHREEFKMLFMDNLGFLLHQRKHDAKVLKYLVRCIDAIKHVSPQSLAH
eukprot:jgi/Chrzof1/9274/UNPLg00241.t1